MKHVIIRQLVVPSLVLLIFTASASAASDGQQALGWVCSNQGWIGPLLAVIIPASFVSGFADKMPPWLGKLVHILALNWPTVVRLFLNSGNPPPTASAKK